MSDSKATPLTGYRAQIAANLKPVRPLAPPSRRTWMLAPLGLLLAVTAPALTGGRGDLAAYSPALSWGVTAAQSLAGLWLLALGFREAVPGRNVSRSALGLASILTLSLIVGVTVLTNAASATVVAPGRELLYWAECVFWPMVVGAPFMILATLMAVRAFPTRPSIAGALCGLSAGILSDAGWRLTCWISDPVHILQSHGLAILGLAAAGSLLAVIADRPRWKF
jgi:hypothetical protein